MFSEIGDRFVKLSAIRTKMENFPDLVIPTVLRESAEDSSLNGQVSQADSKEFSHHHPPTSTYLWSSFQLSHSTQQIRTIRTIMLLLVSFRYLR